MSQGLALQYDLQLVETFCKRIGLSCVTGSNNVAGTAALTFQSEADIQPEMKKTVQEIMENLVSEVIFNTKIQTEFIKQEVNTVLEGMIDSLMVKNLYETNNMAIKLRRRKKRTQPLFLTIIKLGSLWRDLRNNI